MKKTLSFIFLVFNLVAACGDGVYYTKSYSPKKQKQKGGFEPLSGSELSIPIDRLEELTGEDLHEIKLNNTFSYYIRKVYRDSTEEGRIVKSQLHKKDQKEDLIEVGYLFISPKQNMLIYITTVPDLRKKYYSSDRWLGEDTLNVHDFRSFLFGTYEELPGEGPNGGKPSKVILISKDSIYTDIWEMAYDQRKEVYKIESITEEKNGQFQLMVPVNTAFADTVKFERTLPDPALVYYQEGAKDLPEKPVPVINKAFYISKSNLLSNKYNLLFFFRNDDGSLVRGLFKNMRIAYRPDPLFNN